MDPQIHNSTLACFSIIVCLLSMRPKDVVNPRVGLLPEWFVLKPDYAPVKTNIICSSVTFLFSLISMVLLLVLPLA